MAGEGGVSISPEQAARMFEQERLKLEVLERRRAGLEMVLTDVLMAEGSLKGLKEVQKGDKSLVSLGAGVFVEAELSSGGSVKRSLAGRALKSDSIDNTLQYLESQRKELERGLEALKVEEERTMKNLENLGAALNRVARSLKSKGN